MDNWSKNEVPDIRCKIFGWNLETCCLILVMNDRIKNVNVFVAKWYLSWTMKVFLRVLIPIDTWDSHKRLLSNIYQDSNVPWYLWLVTKWWENINLLFLDSELKHFFSDAFTSSFGCLKVFVSPVAAVGGKRPFRLMFDDFYCLGFW